MVCIYCGGNTGVINSRPQKRQNHVWRRRQCLDCRSIFTSVEQPDLNSSIIIQDSTGHIKPFIKEKLFLDIYECCRHRKTAVNDATALTDTILSLLPAYIINATLKREDLVRAGSEVLKRFDRVAQVHYLAYHPLH